MNVTNVTISNIHDITVQLFSSKKPGTHFRKFFLQSS